MYRVEGWFGRSGGFGPCSGTSRLGVLVLPLLPGAFDGGVDEDPVVDPVFAEEGFITRYAIPPIARNTRSNGNTYCSRKSILSQSLMPSAYNATMLMIIRLMIFGKFGPDRSPPINLANTTAKLMSMIKSALHCMMVLMAVTTCSAATAMNPRTNATIEL